MILEPPVTDWYCPRCSATDQTRIAGPHDRMHVCPRLRMLTVPMVRRGVDAMIELNEPEDYIGNEQVRRDPELGRPVMNIVTTRADGSNDCMVFAPTATARLGDIA